VVSGLITVFLVDCQDQSLLVRRFHSGLLCVNHKKGVLAPNEMHTSDRSLEDAIWASNRVASVQGNSEGWEHCSHTNSRRFGRQSK
jgi:hypothetical protein